MLGLASVLLLGVGAQWLAWRLRLPSILLMLLVGFVAGPFTGFLHPDEILGDALFPFVSLSVAIILFEGGLSLRLRDLREAGRAVRGLIVIGIPVTFALATAAAVVVLDMEPRLALLLGSILVVTGPTVIVPLLRHVRPSGASGSVALWEGVVNDALGAALAVLVFQAIKLSGLGDASTAALAGAARAGGIGILAGGAGAALTILLLGRYWVPDFLHSPVVLALALGAFVLADAVQAESGLLAVTLMGLILANQRWVLVEHIVEFKENLRVLLISSLFVLLGARLPLSEFTSFDPRSLVFVVVLIVVVRPACVFCSTLGSGLDWRERVFLACMAPRGIVAAAVASVFALELGEEGFEGAERLVSVTFFVVLGTVAVYGLAAAPLARRLGLSKASPQGVLFVGAHTWAREMALLLKSQGIDVLLVDTDRFKVRRARMQGLRVYHGNVLAEQFDERAPLAGMGHALCVTPGDELNSLAALHLLSLFDRSEVYQLAPGGGPDSSSGEASDAAIPKHLRGRILFRAGLTYSELQSRFLTGGTVKATKLTEGFDFSSFLQTHGNEEQPVIPLFSIAEDGRLTVYTDEKDPDPRPGETLIAVVGPDPAGSPEPQGTPQGSL